MLVFSKLFFVHYKKLCNIPQIINIYKNDKFVYLTQKSFPRHKILKTNAPCALNICMLKIYRKYYLKCNKKH